MALISAFAKRSALAVTSSVGSEQAPVITYSEAMTSLMVVSSSHSYDEPTTSACTYIWRKYLVFPTGAGAARHPKCNIPGDRPLPPKSKKTYTPSTNLNPQLNIEPGRAHRSRTAAICHVIQCFSILNTHFVQPIHLREAPLPHPRKQISKP